MEFLEDQEAVARLAPVLLAKGQKISQQLFSELCRNSEYAAHRINPKSAVLHKVHTQIVNLFLRPMPDVESMERSLIACANRYTCLEFNSRLFHEEIAARTVEIVGQIGRLSKYERALRSIERMYFEFVERSFSHSKHVYRQLCLKPNGWEGFKPLLVAHTEWESATTKSLYLISPHGEELPSFHAGQHVAIKIKLPFLKEPLLKIYKLSGNPRHHGYRITIDGCKGGLFSCYLNSLRTGSFLPIHMPMGAFGVESSARKHLVLAEGVDVATAASLLHEISSVVELGTDVTFIQCAANRASMILKPEFDALQRKTGLLHKVCLRDGEADYNGYPDERVLHDWLDEAEINTESDVVIYLCGRDKFVTRYGCIFTALGYRSEQIRSDYFPRN